MKRLFLIAGLVALCSGCILDEYWTFEGVSPQAKVRDNREIDNVDTPRRAGEGDRDYRQRADEEERMHDALNDKDVGVDWGGPSASFHYP